MQPMKSMRLISEILGNASAVIVEDLRGPTNAVKKTDTVLGEIPPDLRGLWSVMNEKRAEHEHLCTGAGSKGYEQMDEDAARRHRRQHDMAFLQWQAADVLLKVSLADLYSHKIVGDKIEYRDGWVAVCAKENGPSVHALMILGLDAILDGIRRGDYDEDKEEGKEKGDDADDKLN